MGNNGIRFEPSTRCLRSNVVSDGLAAQEASEPDDGDENVNEKLREAYRKKIGMSIIVRHEYGSQSWKY